MNSKLAKRIQEMFRVSEVITVNEEAITPIYKVRENAEKFSIKEDELKEYLEKFAPSDCWKSHATLTLLAKQDCPLWLQYD